ncbi:MAG: hypothetical protein GY719_32960 [bacterium]|nr:hypothetical protein [bacterium]
MTQSSHPHHPSSASQLAVLSLSAQGKYGAVTDLARERGVRRQRVYDIRERAHAALEAEFTLASPELRGSFPLTVAPGDMERAVVALRVVTPASMRDIVEVLPVLYGVRWSYGKVWGVLNDAEQCAAYLLEQVDLSGIDNIAVDEMFSQGRPVLAGLDLDTQYLFQIEVHRDRSAQTWAESLGRLRDRQGLQPKRVVKDAGTGLGAGVRQCWPGIEEHDDLFHAVYRMGKEAYHMERGAYRAINAVDELEHRRAKAKNKSEQQRRSLGQKLRQARKRMGIAIDRYDRFEALRREASRVLELTDRGSGQLRTSGEVVEVLTRIAGEMKDIGGRRVCKVARYIGNRALGLGRYLDSLADRLQAVTDEAGGDEVVEAAVRAYQASLEVERRGPAWDRRARRQELNEATRHLLDAVGHDLERLQRAVGIVMPQLAHRYRASSAIENLNSVLRPYLVVQKHAEQGFLGLFQFYWNTRTRQWGRWKGTSAHELLTGNKVGDWLTMLGFPPSEAFAAAA